MTNKLEFYRCLVCGNVVQVLLDGEGGLSCCGEAMELLEPKTTEGDMGEYHVPVFMHDDAKGTFVQVGKEPHPMTEEHHIEFIQLISEDKKCTRLHYLEPGEEPKMYLNKSMENQKKCAVEMCNLHGLWKGENDEH